MPPAFAAWFAARGWAPRPHQLDLLRIAGKGHSALLVAPTGAGKTLAGFLPSLVALSQSRAKPSERKLHTLYISPLKALAVDIARNLDAPVEGIGLSVRIETRTGDTPAHKRTRQIERPPDILLTTPEQLALLIAHREAAEFFSQLRCVVLDELHALVTSKRGDLLSLALARLHRLSPGLAAIGLSATVREPDELRKYLVPQNALAPPPKEAGERGPPMADLVVVRGGAAPNLHLLEIGKTLPLAGHTAWHSMPAIYDLIRSHRTVLVFVNTRLQAEYTFQELWRLNDDVLPIALHHGSLDATQRRRVEAAMAAGSLRAIVCTATLDLGIDWGDSGQGDHASARPRARARLVQRIGRANHRHGRAQCQGAAWCPANRFESTGMQCGASTPSLAGELDGRAAEARLGGAGRAGTTYPGHGLRRRRSIPVSPVRRK